MIYTPVEELHKHPTVLDPNAYKLNNVILIVDVSSSMNRYGKLDQLRTSFGILVDALRVNDRVTVISMSSEAQIVQPTTGVIDRDSLKSKMNSIKANGGTNGGAAIQLAYRIAKEHFVEGGNNQVIIATDGIFYGGSLSRKEMENIIASGNTSGIHLSTVAFGSDPKALQFLQNLSTLGGGSNIQINQHDDQELLLQMIKLQSRR